MWLSIAFYNAYTQGWIDVNIIGGCWYFTIGVVHTSYGYFESYKVTMFHVLFQEILLHEIFLFGCKRFCASSNRFHYMEICEVVSSFLDWLFLVPMKAYPLGNPSVTSNAIFSSVHFSLVFKFHQLSTFKWMKIQMDTCEWVVYLSNSWYEIIFH